MKERKDIEEKYKWDTSVLGITDENFYQKCEELKEFAKKFDAYKGKLTNKDTILEFYNLDEQFNSLITPIVAYLHLKNAEELSVIDYAEMTEHFNNVCIEISKNTIFVTFELKKLTNAQLDDIISDKRFANFDKIFIDLKRERKHRLSNQVEQFLVGADFLGSNAAIMSRFTDIDMKFDDVKDSSGKKHELYEANVISLMESDDRVLRRNTLKTLHGTFGKYINMLSENYINAIKEDCFFAKARKYKSALDKSLFLEHIDPKIYNMLVKNVKANLDLLFDYFDLKRQKLGLKDFYNYDAYAKLDFKNRKTYTYEEAIELIKKAVAPLGQEYVDLIQKAKDERWVDVFPNKDKESGGFQVGYYGYHPFVLINFVGVLEDVFTLAHELGHAMHSYYSNKAQSRLNAQHEIFIAEVASTTNEMLLLFYLLNNAKSKNEKEALYNKLFESVKGTIFRQTMFAEFEEKVHAMHESGDPLTKEKLCKLYYSLNQEYFGKKVKLLDEVAFEWARIPHFFNAFYVYQYSSGLICALNIAQKLINDKSEKDKYISQFLSVGCKQEPIQILKNVGCDLTQNKTYTQTFDYLKSQLDAWKNLK